MIAIVDYGSGNVAAIADIFKRLKVAHAVTADLGQLRDAERYVLAGVGAFDTTMREVRRLGLVEVLEEQVLRGGKKVLGICVGMQILADSSDEGRLPGLGWIHGRVRLVDAATLKQPPRLPHMGWNSIRPQPSCPLFEGVDAARGFYFLHSYHFDAADSHHVVATVDYGGEIACAVARDNIFGVQFHPEKSHSNGVAILRNFAAL